MTQSSERPKRPAVFHEKHVYRRRRLMDAAKLVPVLAIMLWSLPLIWPQSGDDPVSSSSALVYIFVVWAGLIGLTFVLSVALRSSTDDPEGEER